MTKILIIIIILFSKISFAIDVDDAIKSTIENNPKVKIAFEKLEESKDDFIGRVYRCCSRKSALDLAQKMSQDRRLGLELDLG